MAVTVFKTFVAGETLTAADLNSSFTQITTNGESLGWPATTSKDLNGNELILDGDADTSITADTDDQIDVRLQAVDAFIFDGTTASIVNGLTFGASATGVATNITAQGTDTDISINLVPKGTGTLQVGGSILSAIDGASNIIATQVFA